MPAYAGLISSMGLVYLMKTAYLLPLTAAFLVIAIGSLALRARRRRGYGPFVLGIAAAMLLLTGKFIYESNPAMYISAGLLFTASIWNAWPRRAAMSGSVTPSESLHQIGSNENEVQS
ncbi:MAG: hypothetical protein WD049_08790 [Candidatus Paceibacterota bacterium]